ncbi:MAG: formylglycine-generating enzyme family protein [Thiolinea sp.]
MPRNHLSPPVFPHRWASEYGQDQYGLWQAFTYKNVRYAFRWIPPGTFVMGSPENEEGRTGAEEQHQVILSYGFWLGETTVTQALWEAVIGENPSHFKGEQRPVDTVSWDDCQDFISALHKVHPDLTVGLPTEAQWEYACRGGTTTAFHFGGKDDLTTDKVNYSGQWDNYDLDGETKAVKGYPCNAWGLYEMHGNVWEWCRDVWQENLGSEPVSDPVHEAEAGTAGVRRVLRGGSWGSRGRRCRSAIRDGFGPDGRLYGIGFRLSLGHAELQQPDGRSRRERSER